MPAPRACPQDSTTDNAKNSHVSGTQAMIRQASGHACPRHAAFSGMQTAATLCLLSSVVAAAPNWDCRSRPDGTGWQCEEVARPPDTQAKTTTAGGESSTTARTDVPTDALPSPTAREDAPRPTAPAAATTEASDIAPPATSPDHAPADPGETAPRQPGQSAAAPPEVEEERPTAPGPHTPHYPQRLEATEDVSLAAPTAAIAAGTEPRAATVPALAGNGPLPADLDAGIDWDSCPSTLGLTAGPVVSDSAFDESQPIEVSADAAVAELAPERASFSGKVDLTQGTMRMQAEELQLDRIAGEINAQGDVLLIRPDVRVAGETASYNLNERRGDVGQARYRVSAARARGDAAHAEFLGDGLSRYRDISYTTCAPGDDAWMLNAGELELDQNEGLGTARHATLRFKGVPLLYAPTFTFPTDDRRRSGLLIPTIGQSSTNGFDVSVPYYFNLAENYDLTLAPRLMSKRGAMLGGEFRALTPTTEAVLEAEFLPNDRIYDANRGAARLRSSTRFNARTVGNLRLGYVSDDDYLEDLGNSLAATSTRYVERAGELNYYGDTFDVLGRLQYYQTIDPAIPPRARPYSRLPQLLVDLNDPYGLAGSTYHLDAEYVNFHRENSLRGHRVNLFPRISLPLRETWGFVEPKVGAHYTTYRLDDQLVGLDDSPSSFTGLFSLDSGLYFDRSTSYFGDAAVQTLEPRVYYLYVPYTDQSDQPVFDTGLFDFNFDNLFRENRFNGPDRFADANQATLALTSRFIADATGAELLRANIGQIFYFQDREVTLPGEIATTDNRSSFVGELAAEFGAGWRARAGLQWDPHADGGGNTEQGLVQINYRDPDRRTFNAAYRLRDGVTEQTDLAIYWPINDAFSVIGRHNYSLQEDRLLEALVGVEYGRCCWRIRGLLRQFANSSGDDTNLGFFVQLELRGLGRLGNDIDEVLERGIYGYREDYYD
jgi:LPS-assembly protein